MNQCFTAALENGRITNVRDYNSISAWLDEDMSECLTRKKEGMNEDDLPRDAALSG